MPARISPTGGTHIEFKGTELLKQPGEKKP
jgi:hypothetical protein